MLNIDANDLAYTEVVKHVGGFYDDFRETMQTVQRLEAVLFFTTMLYKNEAYVQPVVIPAGLANRLYEVLSQVDPMSDKEMTDYITKVFRLMQVNTLVPAPIAFHSRFLEMFERMVINGMADRPEIVAQLGNMSVGNLVLIQFILEEDQVTTGLRVVPDALSVYEQALLMSAPTSTLVH